MKKRGGEDCFSIGDLQKNRLGQMTIFIIIAIAVVGAAALFFVLRQGISFTTMPADFQPVYNSFLDCIRDDAAIGASVLGTQGGYINVPDFEPGSFYMPFSSQLDFLGNPIPYWFYVSGNNIKKEQVPTTDSMQDHLSRFIEDKIRGCNFESYYSQGFSISLGDPTASASIKEKSIDVTLDSDLTIIRGNETAVVGTHKVSINSEIGGLYNSAKKIYDYEQQNLFLENYGIDVLRLYAPVDGVEITCSPMTWDANMVFDDLKNAIELNTLAIKVRSNSISANSDKYFVSDISVSYEVRFLNSANWSSAFEVSPAEESLLISTPVGTQPDLGILGFCYVPYHFVYSAKYPVLVQVLGKQEVFQFPTAVIIQGNRPREPADAEAADANLPEVCRQKTSPQSVGVFDSELNKIDAEISYDCSGTICGIGRTSSGTLDGNFPQCVNGFVVVKADGYGTKKLLYSTVDSGNVNIVLSKFYSRSVQLKIDGKNYDGQAIITFSQDNGDLRTVVYPDQKNVNLSEGQYVVQVQAYKNSSLTIGATTSQKCIDVPQSGLGGFFGLTKQNCYTLNMPSQIVSNALAGGGKQNYYFLESKLKDASTIEIDADGLPLPTTIEQLQQNYILFDGKGLRIDAK